MPNGTEYTEHDKARNGNHGSKPGRSPFEVDKGRIIHSGSFRHLQGKTQVLGVGERDFYRTRLTHSLEVAQLGRGLCLESDPPIQIDLDLVETICLAHDIGHSPFGHSGEDVLHQKLNSYIREQLKKNEERLAANEELSDGEKDADLMGGFGANPQNLRIVALLEAKYDSDGLDLTRATLDGLVKYTEIYDPTKHQKKSKFLYTSDEPLFKWIKEGVKDPSKTPLEGQIADWADQMAYSINDFEDVVRAGLLAFQTFVVGEMRSHKRQSRSTGKLGRK